MTNTVRTFSKVLEDKLRREESRCSESVMKTMLSTSPDPKMYWVGRLLFEYRMNGGS